MCTPSDFLHEIAESAIFCARVYLHHARAPHDTYKLPWPGTSQTHTAHVVQSAEDCHAWNKYIHHRHTQPMWYSPQRTLMHWTSTSQTHAHGPCGTDRSGLSCIGQVHHRHTQPMWYIPQRTLMHVTSTSQTHTAHVVQSAANSHTWDKYITDTHIPCGTVRSGLSCMGQAHYRHTQPM